MSVRFIPNTQMSSKKARDLAQCLKHLPGKCEIMSSVPSAKKRVILVRPCVGD